MPQLGANYGSFNWNHTDIKVRTIFVWKQQISHHEKSWTNLAEGGEVEKRERIAGEAQLAITKQKQKF